MQRNKGKKARKKGGNPQSEKLLLREDNGDGMQQYAWVKQALGACRFVLCMLTSCGVSDKTYIGHVPGKLRRRKYSNFVRVGSVVLITKREGMTNDDKVDIVHVYRDDAVRKLVRMGEIISVDSLNDGENAPTNEVIFSDEVIEEGNTSGAPTRAETTSTATATTTPSTTVPASSLDDWAVDVDDI